MPDQTPAEGTEATPSKSDSAADPVQTDTAQTPPDEQTEEAATDETEEALEPSTVHPAAPAGFTEQDATTGGGEHGQFFIGMWGDKPNFGCPYCYFSTIEGSGVIELHILSKIDSGDIKHRGYETE